jgi:Outer membrane protein and related peptidoglycan-associated (lipo)proteins
MNKLKSKGEWNELKGKRKQKEGSAMKVWFVCLGVLLLLYGVIGCSTTEKQRSSEAYVPPPSPSIVGPAGPSGPAGPVGAQGTVGATGAPGAGVAGATGEKGVSGPTGIQGAVGETGPAGAVAVGRAGVTGAAGPAGAEGTRGATGEQGASTAGSTGSIGQTGPQGAQGITGETGAKGTTLVGPAGPAGSAGVAGEQGAVGTTGARGVTTAGVAGSTGSAGNAGPQGPAGATGARGPAGVIDRWTSYRTFWFESNTADLRSSDMSKVSEIAGYMQQNPSLKVGIDGSIPPGSDQDLGNRRVSTVRAALIKAGMPASRIEMGAFGEAQLAREGRVEVLIRTR